MLKKLYISLESIYKNEKNKYKLCKNKYTYHLESLCYNCAFDFSHFQLILTFFVELRWNDYIEYFLFGHQVFKKSELIGGQILGYN